MSAKKNNTTPTSQNNNTSSKPEVSIAFPQSVYIQNSDQTIRNTTIKKSQTK